MQLSWPGRGKLFEPPPIGVTYLSEVPGWADEWAKRRDRPFRCSYCQEKAEAGDARLVAREPAGGPGQFMLVHRVECRRRRWVLFGRRVRIRAGVHLS